MKDTSVMILMCPFSNVAFGLCYKVTQKQELHFHGIGVNCEKLKFENSGIIKNAGKRK